MSNADDRRDDFLKNQYTTLRGEINKHYDKQHWWLVYATAANGAIYLWIIEKGQSQHKYVVLLLFVSLCITVACWRLFDINQRTAERMIKYCGNLEREFISKCGWDDTFKEYENEYKEGTKRRIIAKLLSYIFPDKVIEWLFVWGTEKLIRWLFGLQIAISIISIIVYILYEIMHLSGPALSCCCFA